MIFWLITVHPRVRALIEYTLRLCNKHLSRLQELFESKSIPTPLGFTDDDVNERAARLYSDIFYLGYILNIGKQDMTIYVLILSIFRFYTNKYYGCPLFHKYLIFYESGLYVHFAVFLSVLNLYPFTRLQRISCTSPSYRHLVSPPCSSLPSGTSMRLTKI
ncbi:DUF3231 family protein [Paenibacillus caseinilyticus]|uniref:DUF3231 family protein n=1 Tax=Paenibacillus mucilaginosus TaxID=61624 RepID=UPI0013E89AC8